MSIGTANLMDKVQAKAHHLPLPAPDLPWLFMFHGRMSLPESLLIDGLAHYELYIYISVRHELWRCWISIFFMSRARYKVSVNTAMIHSGSIKSLTWNIEKPKAIRLQPNPANWGQSGEFINALVLPGLLRPRQTKASNFPLETRCTRIHLLAWREVSREKTLKTYDWLYNWSCKVRS